MGFWRFIVGVLLRLMELCSMHRIFPVMQRISEEPIVTHPASTFITMQNCTVRNNPNFSGILAGRHQEEVSCNFSFINTNSHGHGFNSPTGSASRDICCREGYYGRWRKLL